MAAIRVIDMQAGDNIDFELGVVECARRITSTGKPYAQLVVRDASGDISVKKWDLTDGEWEAVNGVQCVHVVGTVISYQGKLEISANRIRPGIDPDRTEGFIPEYPGDRGQEWREFTAHARSVSDPHLSELLWRVFKLPGFTEAFRQATAAQRMHHVGAGGLLAHTLEVVNLCMAVAERTPRLRRDLLLTGAILHDIGKIDEMEMARADFGTTVDGGLVGHVVMGAAKVQRVIEDMPDFPANLRAAVLHLILSHQGTREWGAPILPAIPEAMVLHACDNVSAKLDEFASARAESGGNALFAWSNAVKSHVFLGDIEVSEGSSNTMPQWSLDNDEATGRPVLRIITGGLSNEETLPEMAALPILGSIAAGVPIEAQEHVNGYLALPLSSRTDAGDFLLRVTGDSMRDAHILNGDLVRVRSGGSPREGDIVAALLNGEVTVKRFHRDENGVSLLPENPEFSELRIGESDTFEIQGRVVSLIREQIH